MNIIEYINELNNCTIKVYRMDVPTGVLAIEC